ncbi:prefoldin subunit beta [Candidatus Woesearchaeota archaeon]|nr:prefoldin subunit beta [Candidatus Woesearchaeota archaeon]
MADLTKEQEDKIAQLQMFEQNLQGSLVQKQNLQAQLMEIESALNEVGNAETPYKIIGNIMVRTDKDSLKKDLEQKKEVIELRIKSLEKQEQNIKDKAKKTQTEVLEGMNK